VSGGSDGGTPVFQVNVDDNNATFIRMNVATAQLWSDCLINGSWNGGSGGATPPSAVSGKLRITRVGQVVNRYYWNGSAWVQVATSNSAVLAKPMHVLIGCNGTGNLVITRVDVANFTINSGTPVNTAGWAREVAGTTRGSRADFPEKALIVSTVEGVDILDTSTSKLWMRFIRAANNALHSAATEPRRTMMRNGCLLVSYSGGGTVQVDFTHDDIAVHAAQAETWTGATLRTYNGVNWGPADRAGRDAGAVGVIASRNLAGGYSGDRNNWQIPSTTVRFTDIYEDGGYLYKVHATLAGIGVTKWRRGYNDGATGSNWWNPIYFSSVVTTDMWWCWVDPSDGTLYYLDRDDTPTGGTVGTVYKVAKAVWTATVLGGTFAADVSKVRPSNRMWTYFRGWHGSSEAIVRGGYIYHASDEGLWRIDSNLAGSWELYVGPVGGSAVLPILPADLLGVSGVQFCKDDAALVDLLLVDCVRNNSRYQLHVINWGTGMLYAKGLLRKSRNSSYVAGSVV